MRMQRRRTSILRATCCTFFAMTIGLVAQSALAKAAEKLTPAQIDNAAISAMTKWHGKKTTILSHLDLTGPFNTKSQWTLVVIQQLTQSEGYSRMVYGAGPIAICFVKELSPQCSERNGSGGANSYRPYSMMHFLMVEKVVYANRKHTIPLLWLKTCSAASGDGDCDKWAVLYHYDRNADRFHSVFSYNTGGNNRNQNARFIGHGPILGYVVTDYPTEHPPYTYWIEVYALGKGGQYKRILKYRGHTGYGDGNPLPVAYSEMPEILRRLGYWKPGDAIPLPPGISCPHPVLRHKEEWCD